MKHWINTHYKNLIIGAFLVPIITVAIVSISHVTKWYGISNPVSWAIYLSIGIEIAALSALAAISADMGKKIYFPFAIVTLVQFIGNVFFAYSFIDINSKLFIDWIDLVSPLVSFMGVEPTDLVGHKRFLAFFSGGMLPIISLSFLHMLVKFTEEGRKKELEQKKVIIENKEPLPTVEAKDIIGEVSRLRLSENDLKKLEDALLNSPLPSENLKEDSQIYKKEVEIRKPVEDNLYLEKEEIVNNKPVSIEEKTLNLKQVVFEPKEENKSIFPENMEYDEEYNRTVYPSREELKQEPITPAISDEKVREMFMDEWERKFELVEEDENEEEIYNVEPTEEEENQNFSTIEQNPENILQNTESILDTQTNTSKEDEKKN